MADRVLALNGIHNFRDYGGYRARAGHLVRGRLWRSGQHHGADDADLARVAALDLATVIDLRGDSERAIAPCRRPAGFAAAVLFAPGETGDGKGAGAQAIQADLRSVDDARAMLLAIYAAMPFRQVLTAAMRLYFEALAERDGASLVHCLAGKDRTGLTVAFLHALLGVHDDDIHADYGLTNLAGDPEARIAAAAAHVRASFGPAMDDATLRYMMSVQPELLDAAFGAIAARYGSLQAYAAAELGVDAARLARIEARLVG